MTYTRKTPRHPRETSLAVSRSHRRGMFVAHGNIATTSRPGVSLLEVLVAIFVMGIGLLALLTLFPLGAMRMASAFKDERAAQAAVNARAIAIMKNIRGDSLVMPKYKNPGGGQPDANKDAPSYPVFVDPVGYFLGKTTLGTNISRVAPSFVTGNTVPSYFHFFHLLDDITFQRNLGAPKFYGSPTPTYIERELLYQWAYLVQRPRFDDHGVTNCSVCVFQRRPKAGNLETEYTATMDPTKNTIKIVYTGTAPDIQAGQWILDGTKIAANNYAYANFYRITGVRDSGSDLTLDTQTPLLGYTTTTTGKVIVLDGLVEVFDLGPGR